jgi:AraC-like DNA-binding protein
MRYAQFPVPAALTPWVECVWRLTGVALPETPSHRVFPDGCLELVIHAGDRFRERADDGAVRLQPHRLIVGQMMRPVTLVPTGVIDVWGIRFHPWGAGLIVDAPASALTGRIEDAIDVAPDLTLALERAVRETAGRVDVREAVAALCRVLLARLGDVAEPDALSAHAARQMLQAPHATSVTDLAADAGLSVRQLERRFLATVGLSPKMFARIARFQHVCAVLDGTPEQLAAAALRCGYYDQSHLSRDVRDFTGSTPSALRAIDSLTEHFLRVRRPEPTQPRG